MSNITPQIWGLTPGVKYGQKAIDQIQNMSQEMTKYVNMAKGYKDGDMTYKMNMLRGERDAAMVRDLLVDDLLLDKKGSPILGKDGKVQIAGKNRWQKWNDMQYQRGVRDDTGFTHSGEVQSYKAIIERYIRWPAPEPEIIPERDLGRGILKWTYFRTNDIPAPSESLTFEQRGNTIPTNTQYDASLMGFYYDYHLDMVTRDASNNPNTVYSLQPRKQEWIMQELTRSMAVYKQWYHYRGTSIEGLNDLGITGLINDSAVTNDTTIGDAGDLTSSYLGVTKAAEDLAQTLLDAKRFPPYTLDLSPGAFIRASKNINPYNGKTEIQNIYDLPTEKKVQMFDQIRINPFLINGVTETSSTGAMAVYKVGQQDFEFAYSYPMAFYPLPPVSLGVDGKLLFMGKTILYQPSAVAYGGSLKTA
jgi:hypothetical protein